MEREAAFFNVGDIISWGKYKNKKGRIVAFDENAKGQPTVEIEPIPKGRKQNKTMGLFKIWQPAAIPPKEATALKVAARYLHAALGLGRTLDHGSVRIHRYRDNLRVTDLTNAGKRGKNCKSFTAAPTYQYKDDHQKWLDRMSKFMVRGYKDYRGMLNFIKDIQHDVPNEIEINESEEKGIFVTPAGGKLKVEGVEVEGTAEPHEFLLKHRTQMRSPKTGEPGHWQDTLYSSRKRRDAGLFYGWLKDNLSQVKNMDIYQLRKLWDKLGVKYNFH